MEETMISNVRSAIEKGRLETVVPEQAHLNPKLEHNPLSGVRKHLHLP